MEFLQVEIMMRRSMVFLASNSRNRHFRLWDGLWYHKVVFFSALFFSLIISNLSCLFGIVLAKEQQNAIRPEIVTTIGEFISLYQANLDKLTADGNLYEYKLLTSDDAPRIQIAFEDQMQFETVIDDANKSKSYLCCGLDDYLLIFLKNQQVEGISSFIKQHPNIRKTALLRPWTGFLGVVPLDYKQEMYADVIEVLKQLENVSFIEEIIDNNHVIFCRGHLGNISVGLSLDRDHGFITKKVFFENPTPEIGKNKFFSLVTSDFFDANGIFIPRNIKVNFSIKAGKVDSPLGVLITYDPTPRNLEYELFHTKDDTSEVITGKAIFNKIVATIPNGTTCRMQDVPQIEYVWLDGKIEPKTNELMLKIAQGGHKFIPGVSEPRFWLMAIGVLFVVVGFSLKAKTLIKQWREK